MKKIIFGFSLGVLAGIYFSPRHKTEPVPETTQVEKMPVIQPPVKNRDQSREAVTRRKLPQISVSNSEISEDKKPKADKKLVVLNISEARVEALEQNFSELQRDISLFKDDRGWTVRFHRNTNLLSSMGIQDNDLISFELFQQLKKDPSKGNLVSRLEIIFSNLER